MGLFRTLVASWETRASPAAELNPVVLAQVRTLEAGGGDLRKLDAVLLRWRWTGEAAVHPEVAQLVSELLANRPEFEKEAVMRDVVDRLRHEAMPTADAHALMDALRVVRSKHFRR